MMVTSLNPKLLDVVSFSSSTTHGQPMTYTGTVVELFGADTALIEVSDESGVTQELEFVPLRDLKVVWSSTEPGSEKAHAPEAQRDFEEGIFLLQNGVFSSAKEKFKKAFA